MKDETTRKYWSQLEARHDGAADAVLAAAYAEPDRAYHSTRHIDDLLQKLDRLRHLAERPDLVAAAVFWHDAIYATRERDGRSRSDAQNVRDSLALFRKHARFPQNDADAIADMIAATAAHAEARAAREFYPGYALDLDLFLDLDLSSLAAPWPVFSQNLDDIRFEYAWVPEQEFAAGRLQMLETLARDGARLFRRDETAKVWEAPARENIARVTRELRAQLAQAGAVG